MKRVALAIPRELVRAGLEQYLKAGANPDFQIVASKGSVKELLPAILATPPEIIVIYSDEADALIQSLFQLRESFLAKMQPAVLLLMPFLRKFHYDQLVHLGIKALLKSAAAPEQIIAALTLLPAHRVVDETIIVPQALTDDRLTMREREVGMLLAEGFSVKEIARQFQISVKTAEAHKSNLMRKLDIHNKAHLVNHFISLRQAEAAVIE